jgi:hypothetical protein
VSSTEDPTKQFSGQLLFADNAFTPYPGIDVTFPDTTRNDHSPAFTSVEIVGVVAIIGILAAVAITHLQFPACLLFAGRSGQDRFHAADCQ